MPEALPDRDWSYWWMASGREQLAVLLARAWDPIFRGMPGVHSQMDEYEDIADQMVRSLRRGVGPDELADWLVQVEARMHLLPEAEDRDIDLVVAKAIIDWYDKASPTN